MPKPSRARSLSNIGPLPPSRPGRAVRWQTVVLWSLLILGALAMRLVRLGDIPANLIGDEADNFLDVLSILATGQPGWFGLDWKPAPAFSVRLMSLAVGIWGPSVFSLRLLSAVLSVLALVPFYLLARRFTGRPAALAAAAGLAGNVVILNFSRSGWENVHVCLYSALAFLGTAWILEGKWKQGLAAAGAGCGLGLLGYFSGRLILPVVWLWLLAGVLAGPAAGRAKTLGSGLGLTLLAFLLAAPLLPEIVQRWDYFQARTANVWLLNQHFPNDAFDSLRQAVWTQSLQGAGMFFWGITRIAKYSPAGRPLLDPLTGILVLAGMLLACQDLRRKYSLWLMFLIPLALTQALTTHSPDPARGLGLMVPVYLFFAVGLEGLLALGRQAPRLANSALAALMAIIIFFNVRAYFTWIQKDSTLQERYPAITCAEVPEWIRFQQQQLRAGSRGINLIEWKQRRGFMQPVR